MQLCGLCAKFLMKGFTTQQKQLVDPVPTRHAAFTWIRQQYQQCGEGVSLYPSEYKECAMQKGTIPKIRNNYFIPRNETARPRSQFLYINFSVSDLFCRTIGLSILMQENR